MCVCELFRKPSGEAKPGLATIIMQKQPSWHAKPQTTPGATCGKHFRNQDLIEPQATKQTQHVMRQLDFKLYTPNATPSTLSTPTPDSEARNLPAQVLNPYSQQSHSRAAVGTLRGDWVAWDCCGTATTPAFRMVCVGLAFRA